MKFLVTWRVYEDRAVEVLKLWCSLNPDERAETGEGVRLIGRWHNLAEMTGAAILEAEDSSKLYRYLSRWSPFMDQSVSPVLEDEETAKVASEMLDDIGVVAGVQGQKKPK